MNTINKFSDVPSNLEVLNKVIELVDGYNSAVTAINEKVDKSSAEVDSLTISTANLSVDAEGNLKVNDSVISTKDDLANYLPVNDIADRAYKDADGNLISTTYLKIENAATINSGSGGGIPPIELDAGISSVNNALLAVNSNGTLEFSSANIGAANQAVYFNNGIATPLDITVNTVNVNAVNLPVLPSINNGSIAQSTVSLGSITKPVYLDNGVFKECNNLSNEDSTESSETLLESYGIVGDGETDDTDALQNFINTVGNKILLPAGTYKISSTLIFNSEAVLEGQNATILQITADINTFYVSAPLTIKGITFNNDHITNPVDIAINATNKVILEDCKFIGYSCAINNASNVISIESLIKSCIFEDCSTNIILDYLNKCLITDCISTNSNIFIKVLNSHNINIANCIDKNKVQLVSLEDENTPDRKFSDIDNSTNIVIFNNYLIGNTEGIYSTNCKDITIVNNNIVEMLEANNSSGTLMRKQCAIHLGNCENLIIRNNNIDTNLAPITCIDISPNTPTIGFEHSNATATVETSGEYTITGYYISPTGSVNIPNGVAYSSVEKSYSVTKTGPIEITWTARLVGSSSDVSEFTSKYSIDSYLDAEQLNPTRGISIINNTFKCNLRKPVIYTSGASGIIVKDNIIYVTSRDTNDSYQYQYQFYGCTNLNFYQSEQFDNNNDTIKLLKVDSLESNISIPCYNVKTRYGEDYMFYNTEISTEISSTTQGFRNIV